MAALEELRTSVLDAVAYLSEISRSRPDAVDRRPELANEELATMAAAFGELQAAGEPPASHGAL